MHFHVAPPGLRCSCTRTSGLRHWLHYATPPGFSTSTADAFRHRASVSLRLFPAVSWFLPTCLSHCPWEPFDRSVRPGEVSLDRRGPLTLEHQRSTALTPALSQGERGRFGSRLVACICAVVAWLAFAIPANADETPVPKFAQDVQPLLKRHCLKCHGTAKREAGLDLSTPGGVIRGGKTAPSSRRTIWSGACSGSGSQRTRCRRRTSR